MANPIPCDVCNQTTADFVITDVSDGSVLGLGIECVLDWAVPLAEIYEQAVKREGQPSETAAVSAQQADKAWEDSARPAEPKSRAKKEPQPAEVELETVEQTAPADGAE